MAASLTVVRAGAQTTVQDLCGRTGYWDVGVPPSGAFDDLTFGLLNLALGNPESAGGLECVMTGPMLRVNEDRLICVGGAAHQATIDGREIEPGQPTWLRRGAVLDVGPLEGPGLRGYVAVQGGLDVPRVLGSRATFILGEFGGLDGRALRDDDVIALGRLENLLEPRTIALPELSDVWELWVIPGPHGSPDYLTPDGVTEFFTADWRVDHRADRTGVRLVGPIPEWARDDGGEAGIHPSNLHDSAYPIGGIMLSGDTAVIVGVDGPSLGGFVVPAVVIEADRWKLGQMRPGDAVRLVPVNAELAAEAMRGRRGLASERRLDLPVTVERPAPLTRAEAGTHSPEFSIRRSGDRHLLLEAGSTELDLGVRVWIHLLAESLRSARPDGVVEIVEGVRSLLVAVDTSKISVDTVAEHLTMLASATGDPESVEIASREVILPIAFDHPEAHEAMRRYVTSVRPDAPWCPDNVEFIRRVNDLDGRDEVFDIVGAANYLVIGLGDVYLGAPVAVPLDPRHRLLTTKYNPARTWTPQNAVGIGGIYLCIYGMEGPGGYQLVGRTVPVWRLGAGDERPWLLRQFDQIRFRPVTADELADLRSDIKEGRADLETRPATFSMSQVRALEGDHAAEIAAVRSKRRSAFDAERMRWAG